MLQTLFDEKEGVVNCDLRMLDTHDVALCNRVSSLELALKTTFQGQDIMLSFAKGHRGRLSSEELKVTLSAEEQIMSFYFSKDGLTNICQACGYNVANDRWSMATQRLVCEFIFAPCIEALETALDKKIQFEEVELVSHRPYKEHDLGLTVAYGKSLDEVIEFGFTSQQIVLNKLLDKIPTAQLPIQKLEFLTVPTSLRVGLYHIALQDLRGAQLGDVIMTGTKWASLSPGDLWVGSNFVASTAIENGAIVMASDFKKYTNSNHHRVSTSMEKQLASNILEDLDALLSIEVDRVDIKFSDLENMHVGSVVKLDSDRPDQVVLYTNAHPFAEGDLVQLDDCIGVQITKFL